MKKTVNQLLDIINDMGIDQVTTEIGITRQRLIDIKRSHPKGGLIEVENTGEILKRIAQANEMAKENAMMATMY